MAYRIIPNVSLGGKSYVLEVSISGIALDVLGVYEAETMRPLDADEVSALGDPLIDMCWRVIERG